MSWPATLSQIRNITVNLEKGSERRVPANKFIPWKFVMDGPKGKPYVAAYMCAFGEDARVHCGDFEYCAQSSEQISQKEYERLIAKFRTYSENPLSMFEGFVDYSIKPGEGQDAPTTLEGTGEAGQGTP